MDIFEKWNNFVKKSNDKDAVKKQRAFVLYTFNDIIESNSLESIIHNMDEKTLNQLADIIRKAVTDRDRSSDWTTPR